MLGVGGLGGLPQSLACLNVWEGPNSRLCCPPIAAPGTGGLKFNIQKRPFAVTNQNFNSNAEGQHNSFGPQPNSEKAQNHR